MKESELSDELKHLDDKLRPALVEYKDQVYSLHGKYLAAKGTLTFPEGPSEAVKRVVAAEELLRLIGESSVPDPQ